MFETERPVQVRELASVFRTRSFLERVFFCGKIELLAERVRLWSHAGGGHRKGAHASAEAECKRNGGTTGRGGMNGVNEAAETPKKLFVSNSIFFV